MSDQVGAKKSFLNQWLGIFLMGGTMHAFKRMLYALNQPGGLMIKFKIKQALTAVAFAAGAVGSANAFVISAGDIKITIDGYDIANVSYPAVTGTVCENDAVACNGAGTSPGAPGMGNFDTVGVVSVASITNASGSVTYFTRGTTGYLTGVFGGLLDHTVRTTCDSYDCTTKIFSEGGYFKLYENAAQYDASLGPAGAGVDLLAGIYPGITGGSLYLSGAFVPGVHAGDPTATYFNSYDPATLAGSGQGFLDIVGGKAFDDGIFKKGTLTDKLGNARDLFMDVTYNNVDGAASRLGWTVAMTASIKAAAVPEPGALALIALGMIGAGAATARRKV